MEINPTKYLLQLLNWIKHVFFANYLL